MRSVLLSVLLLLPLLLVGECLVSYDYNLENSEHVGKFEATRDAALNPTDILLANPVAGSVGFVYFNDPIVLNPGSRFSTHFSFLMDQGSDDPADGVQFSLNRDPFHVFSGHDEQFYYVNFFVYLRTYFGIDPSSVEIRKVDCDQETFRLDPTSGCGTPPVHFSNLPNGFEGVIRQYVWIDYDTETQILELRMAQVDSRPALATTTVNGLSLSEFYGDTLYVGFGGVSRSQFARHRLLGRIQFEYYDINECAVNNGECSDNAVCYNIVGSRTCVCKSGFFGDGLFCESALCTLSVPEKTVTHPIAELMLGKSSLMNNRFTFQVTSDATEGRYIGHLSLENENLAECNFPGANIQKSFDENACQDVYTGNFTFPQVIACGFQISTENQLNNTHYIYTGRIKVEGFDDLGDLRGYPITRVTTASISVSLILPKFSSVVAENLTVHSEVNIQAAVTQQAYDPTTDAASIEIITSVQWPYKLNLPTLTSTLPSGLSISSILIEDLTCPTDSPCTQKLTFPITGAQSSLLCNFNGVYDFDLGVICHPNYSPCFINGKTSSLTFTLNSGDLCPRIGIDAHVSGDLVSYTTQNFNTISSVFAAGETIYLKSTVSSSVEIQTLGLHRLRVYSQTLRQGALLRSNGAHTPEGESVSLVTTGFAYTPSRNEFLFSFNADLATFFPSAQPDDIIVFDVEADLSVEYRTTLGKRDIQSQTLGLSHQVVLRFDQIKSILEQQQQQQQQEESSANSLVPIFSLLAFVILALI